MEECVVVGEVKVARVSAAEELDEHLHQLTAGEVGPGALEEDPVGVLSKQLLPGGHGGKVVLFQLDPKIGVVFHECCAVETVRMGGQVMEGQAWN